MKTIQIKHRYSSAVLFSHDVDDSMTSGMAMRATLEAASRSGAYLSRADLSRANLSGAYLSGADLSGADLSGADLSGANLSGAYLSRANLSRADLSGAYLSRADLSRANLSGANLSGADLSGADLSGADLSRADLSDTTGSALAIAQTRILPSEGEVIGWKKCQGGVLVKLRVPADAKRSHAFGRKCRAEFVDVLEVVPCGRFKVARSMHDDGHTIYRAGERVLPDSFSENWQEECAPGIHFFITRAEAEAY